MCIDQEILFLIGGEVVVDQDPIHLISGEVVVDPDHLHLAVGDTIVDPEIPSTHVFCGEVVVHGSRDSSPHWWRSFSAEIKTFFT